MIPVKGQENSRWKDRLCFQDDMASCAWTSCLKTSPAFNLHRRIVRRLEVDAVAEVHREWDDLLVIFVLTRNVIFLNDKPRRNQEQADRHAPSLRSKSQPANP
jgi:hypothetical protein